MTDEALAVIDLIEQFRRLSDPTADPDVALRGIVRNFFRQHLRSKGSEGTSLDEAEAAFRKAIEGAPAQWPYAPTGSSSCCARCSPIRTCCRQRCRHRHNWSGSASR